ncbi:uncharacterized protein LOC127749344 [Frankliniella occidentalis]|uniref:Uncharacterized protein LOC127749344 n=1 Tax=Frankliniella occidentalis TaxID=133901 RepID=A0A9C6U8H9_FRAOC|nr:uncharacterized protein LOC127749344 [Frankliniella occidentalis]
MGSTAGERRRSTSKRRLQRSAVSFAYVCGCCTVYHDERDAIERNAVKTQGQSKDTSGTSDIISITEFREDYHKDVRTAEGLQNPEGLTGIGEGQSLCVPLSIRGGTY